MQPISRMIIILLLLATQLTPPTVFAQTIFAQKTFLSAQDFGAKGDGKTDDTDALQKALDKGGMIILPEGKYLIKKTLAITKNNTVLVGHGAYATILLYDGAASAIENTSGTTLYWCRLANMRIESSNKNTKSPIIKWQSMQFGSLEDLWLVGNGKPGSIGLTLFATPKKTEATYNRMTHLYIGLVETGIILGYGANSNVIQETRIQPLANGVAIRLNGIMSNNHIIHSGLEYPGNVSGGILIEGKVYNTLILGNRFESLDYAWKIKDSLSFNTIVIGNYYDSLKTNWLDKGTKTQNFDQIDLTKDAQTLTKRLTLH